MPDHWVTGSVYTGVNFSDDGATLAVAPNMTHMKWGKGQFPERGLDRADRSNRDLLPLYIYYVISFYHWEVYTIILEITDL